MKKNLRKTNKFLLTQIVYNVFYLQNKNVYDKQSSHNLSRNKLKRQENTQQEGNLIMHTHIIHIYERLSFRGVHLEM